MQYKRAVTRIGSQLPLWFRVERKNSVGADGIVLDPRIDRTSPGRTGTWTAGEDSKLKDAVQTQGGKNWGAITALVPGRTIIQCQHRWHGALDPSIDRANRRMGKWSEDEDRKLKNLVQMHGGKDWAAIAALVPGRTRIQCHNRWHMFLDPSIDWATGRTGTFSMGTRRRQQSEVCDTNAR
jgi:hypothetical protein